MFDKSMKSVALKPLLIERALKTDILTTLLVYEMDYYIVSHCFHLLAGHSNSEQLS